MVKNLQNLTTGNLCLGTVLGRGFWMLTVGVKKVIVDDVTAVDEESEIKSKYLNISLLKTDLNIEKGFPCTVYR